MFRRWDDEVVAYDSRAGDTHLLDPVASAFVTALESSSQTSYKLARMLIREFEPSPDADVDALTEATLVRLRDLGLVDSAPIEDR